MKKRNSFFSYLLYIGVEDERIRAAIDKAGYQTLVLLIFLFGFDVLFRGIVFNQQGLGKADGMIILTISAIFLAIQSYRYGCTFMETAQQRKVMQKYLAYSSLATVGMGYLLVLSETGPIVEYLQTWPLLLWTFPLASGLLAYGFLWLLALIYEKATVSRLDQGLESKGTERP